MYVYTHAYMYYIRVELPPVKAELNRHFSLDAWLLEFLNVNRIKMWIIMRLPYGRHTSGRGVSRHLLKHANWKKPLNDRELAWCVCPAIRFACLYICMYVCNIYIYICINLCKYYAKLPVIYICTHTYTNC